MDRCGIPCSLMRMDYTPTHSTVSTAKHRDVMPCVKRQWVAGRTVQVHDLPRQRTEKSSFSGKFRRMSTCKTMDSLRTNPESYGLMSKIVVKFEKPRTPSGSKVSLDPKPQYPSLQRNRCFASPNTIFFLESSLWTRVMLKCASTRALFFDTR